MRDLPKEITILHDEKIFRISQSNATTSYMKPRHTHLCSLLVSWNHQGYQINYFFAFKKTWFVSKLYPLSLYHPPPFNPSSTTYTSLTPHRNNLKHHIVFVKILDQVQRWAQLPPSALLTGFILSTADRAQCLESGRLAWDPHFLSRQVSSLHNLSRPLFHMHPEIYQLHHLRKLCNLPGHQFQHL